MDDEDKLKKEEERLMRAMSRGGSRGNLGAAAPKKEVHKEPATAPAPAHDASHEEAAWKRRQREEREATERRLAEEKARKEQARPAKAEPAAQRRPSPHAAPPNVATQDEVMSYEERERHRRDEWKKQTNPYEWAMEDPDNRLTLLPELLAAKEREEVAHRDAELAAAHMVVPPAQKPASDPKPHAHAMPAASHAPPALKPTKTSETDEAMSMLADAELNAKKALFLVNVDSVHDSMRGDSFDFRTLAALVRELQTLAPLVAQRDPGREEESKAFLNEPTRELLLKAKSYKDDHDAQKQQELIESMNGWAEGARKIVN